MLQDFAVGLWFRRLQKGSVKSGFSILYPRFSNIVFPPAKSRLYALIFWFYPLLCKGHLSIFDLCWGDFTTPPSYYIGRLFQIFNHPPGSVEGKTPFLYPYRSYCPLSSTGSRVAITGGTLFHGQGNRQSSTTTPEPTRFSITPLISTSNWTHIFITIYQKAAPPYPAELLLSTQSSILLQVHQGLVWVPRSTMSLSLMPNRYRWVIMILTCPIRRETLYRSRPFFSCI